MSDLTAKKNITQNNIHMTTEEELLNELTSTFISYNDVDKIDPHTLREAIKYGIKVGIKMSFDTIGKMNHESIIKNGMLNTTTQRRN